MHGERNRRRCDHVWLILTRGDMLRGDLDGLLDVEHDHTLLGLDVGLEQVELLMTDETTALRDPDLARAIAAIRETLATPDHTS